MHGKVPHMALCLMPETHIVGVCSGETTRTIIFGSSCKKSPSVTQVHTCRLCAGLDSAGLNLGGSKPSGLGIFGTELSYWGFVSLSSFLFPFLCLWVPFALGLASDIP